MTGSRSTLSPAQKYTFTLDGYGSNALEDPYLYLRDSSGTVLVENDDGDGNRNSRIVFTATTTRYLLPGRVGVGR